MDCVMGMEGVRRVRETSDYAKRMAPYANRSPKMKRIRNDKSNGNRDCAHMNGKRLKLNVVKFNNSHLSETSISLCENQRKNRRNSSKSSFSKDLSNNNTIKNDMTVCESNRIEVTPVESCRIGEPSLSNHICSNCTTVADSPQSIISEESSQASDSIFVKDGRFLKRSNSVSSCHSLDSQQSQKTVVAPEPPPPCRWLQCTDPQVDLTKLHEHIKTQHIEPQEGSAKFVCQWQGCRCFGKPSSRSWIDRHILKHSGDKPFQCIIDGCGLRFSSQCLLERHVRNHFTYQEQLEQAKARDNGTPTKGSRKRKLKRKITRPVKTQDFFDARAMEEVKRRLFVMSVGCAADVTDTCHSHVIQSRRHSASTFQSSVIAQRQTPDGTTSVLLRAHPCHRLSGEWVSSISGQAAAH